MARGKRIKNIWEILKQTMKEFKDDRVMKLSAALAYYTVFSLPALILVIISLTGVIFGEEAVSGMVFRQLNDLVGDKAALTVQNAIQNMNQSGKSGVAVIFGVVTLFLSVSGIFGEMQDSINMIWGLRAKRKKGTLRIILNRIVSFSLVLSLGFAMLVSLILNGILSFFSTKISSIFPWLNVTLAMVSDLIIQVVVITLLFSVIFKVLPDAKIKWRDVMTGAFVTTILFMIGKTVLTYVIAKNASIQAYEAAGSVIIILLWFYYSSAILYIGAEFTQIYAMTYGKKIQPNKYAVWIETHVVEQENGDLSGRDGKVIQHEA